MTNTLALLLGSLIIGFLLLDHYVLEWGVIVFTMQKLWQLTDYIAFWR